ncbi:hypothetical protein [Natronoglycomyces albus]|uniref:Uncharacterized protein n=1 Tax=Natronoglycomyces albus TaxID=2811108 RepID=A0A895XMQ0_9ACTN|nr:hypothetical protein [Natronoglycomyces albus]QSB04813.1 hypothetical protein JQS30_13725 [Natronoglycomyces albus]
MTNVSDKEIRQVLSRSLQQAARDRGLDVERLDSVLIRCDRDASLIFNGFAGVSTSTVARKMARNPEWLRRFLSSREIPAMTPPPVGEGNPWPTERIPVVAGTVIAPLSHLPASVVDRIHVLLPQAIRVLPGLASGVLTVAFVDQSAHACDVGIVGLDVTFVEWAKQVDGEHLRRVAEAILAAELDRRPQNAEPSNTVK